MLLTGAQRPLATSLLVVRDEEAAGSNPVTPTSVSAGQRPPPELVRAPLAASTAAKYSIGSLIHVCSSGSCLTIGFRYVPDSFRTRFRYLRDTVPVGALDSCSGWADAEAGCWWCGRVLSWSQGTQGGVGM
jgi:hypothetical protein